MPVLTKDTCYPGLFNTKFNMVNLDLKAINEKVENGTAPFKKLIRCNMGNPNSVGQKEVEFVRQLIAGTIYPELLEKNIFPADVIERCREILNSCIGKNTGSYQQTEGVQIIREHVAEYISTRDSSPCSADSVFLCNGATDGIMNILRPIIRGDQDAILCPKPGFPLYNATATYFGGHEISYELDEENDWAVDEKLLEEAIKKTDKTVRCLVVINPNNPVGAVQTIQNLKNMLKFASKHNLLVIADEVYQHNIYSNIPFISCRKCLKELEAQNQCKGLELISINSASKSMYGECGRRGAYWQTENIDKEVLTQLLDIISLGAINTDGMIAMDAIVKPPKAGEPSYEVWKREYQSILDSLTKKAHMVATEMNSWEGISCRTPTGAMYVFPRIHASANAISAAKAAGKSADELYCQDLLEEVGVICLPGNVFGQKAGTYHLRMTILPDEDEMLELMQRWRVFHLNWMKKYQ
ncbi:Alanine aminotransferase [Spironucleus salmonicida]|uniref:Alanine aminotransferase n=1 Tax=Spironucleus salmonicida TaxID=348837 RepID=V6LAS4_9EUKA|nr:Alanine aminotransferase [Spironucleus salmonicida]|eukprot:EST41323.1 Alanine aminotransferase [Spironucleus salmonicida]